MDEGLRRENRENLSKIASTLSLPYIFMGVVGTLYLLYSSSFISQDIGGILIVALLCLLTPMLTGATANFVVRPLLSNILGNELISNRGCLAGLGVYGLMVLAIVFSVTRDFAMAGYIFLAIPVVAILTAVAVSGVGRMTGGGFTSRRSMGPPTISRPQPPQISGGANRPGLPEGRQTPASRLTPPRRTQIPSPPSRSELPGSTSRPPAPPRKRQ